MNQQAKKLQLIEKILMVSDNALLAAIDATIKNGSGSVRKERFIDFAGAIGDEKLSELDQIITQGCEQINADDWK